MPIASAAYPPGDYAAPLLWWSSALAAGDGGRGESSAPAAPGSHCPVVVVRGPGGPPGAPVVVGVDGTDLSDTVLAFAFVQAARHGVGLRAVLCSTSDAVSDAEEPARALAEALAGWREKYPDVHGRPVDGLVESARARLLVVGTRGRHALAGTLLGSVSPGVQREASARSRSSIRLPDAADPDRDRDHNTPCRGGCTSSHRRTGIPPEPGPSSAPRGPSSFRPGPSPSARAVVHSTS
ncbi:universal stress protein [Actinopolymorpha singaporensis]